MKTNTEIIVEIGYNHLGSPYIVDNILELIAKNNLSITFQVRSINFENKEILDINLNYLLERIKLFKNKFSNSFKILFSIDSQEYLDQIAEVSDFLKILSIFENKEDFFKNTKYEKPIFISLGLNSMEQIQLISRVSKRNNIKFNTIFTSFDSSGEDISIEEINNIKVLSDSVSFGYHQRNFFFITTIASMVNFNKIFLYLNPGLDESFQEILPDSQHSVKISEILKIREALAWKNNIIYNKSRKFFKSFNNE